MDRSIWNGIEKDIESISDSYIRTHPNCGSEDLQVAREYYVKRLSVSEIATSHGFDDEQTVYKKAISVKAAIQNTLGMSAKKYILPKGMILNTGDNTTSSHHVLRAILAKYQNDSICIMFRQELISIYPKIKNLREMNRIIDSLDACKVSFGKDYALRLFQDIEYKDSVLTYRFSVVFERILDLGRLILNVKDAGNSV